MTGGVALICLGVFVVIGYLKTRGRAPRSADLGSTTDGYLLAYRRELEHQIRLLRWVPLWYLAPLVPGMVLFLWRGYRLFASNGEPLGTWTFAVVFCSVVFVGVVLENIRAGRKLQRQLDVLPE